MKLASSFKYVASSGARGGIITGWDPLDLYITNKIKRQHTLTISFLSMVSELTLSVTNVYTPLDHRHSTSFLNEFVKLLPLITGP